MFYRTKLFLSSIIPGLSLRIQLENKRRKYFNTKTVVSSNTEKQSGRILSQKNVKLENNIELSRLAGQCMCYIWFRHSSHTALNMQNKARSVSSNTHRTLVFFFPL